MKRGLVEGEESQSAKDGVIFHTTVGSSDSVSGVFGGTKKRERGL